MVEEGSRRERDGEQKCRDGHAYQQCLIAVKEKKKDHDGPGEREECKQKGSPGQEREPPAHIWTGGRHAPKHICAQHAESKAGDECDGAGYKRHPEVVEDGG